MASLAAKQYRADSIVESYRANGCNLRDTINHFKKRRVNHNTIRRAIKRFEETGNSKFKQITGRPISASTPELCDKVDKELNKDHQLSLRVLAQRTNTSARTIGRVKKKLGYRSCKAISAPKTTPDQDSRTIRGATKNYKNLVPSGGSKILIMDDETYVPIVPTQVSGVKWYSKKPGQEIPDDTNHLIQSI